MDMNKETLEPCQVDDDNVRLIPKSLASSTIVHDEILYLSLFG